MLQEQAHSLRELEDIVGAHFPGSNSCFRGQSDSAWDLVPSAYRSLISYASYPNFDSSWVAQVERDTYREFDIVANKELRTLNTFERLSRAQHHGVPTRLLDWSSNLGVSAYFAMSGIRNADCAVWCLNLSSFPFPKELGRQHIGGGYRLENIQKYGGGFIASFAQPVSIPVTIQKLSPTVPVANSNSPPGTFIVWIPPRVDERLQRQEGLLSWYHSFEEDLIWNYSKYICELEKKHGCELLLKITIPSDKRLEMLNELLKRGITEYFLFHDLDALGRDLSRRHCEDIEFYAQP